MFRFRGPGLRQNIPCTIRISCICLGFCLVVGGLAVPAAPGWGAEPAASAAVQDSTPASKASFAHSGLKTVTYEIGNTLNNFGILSVGAGGLAGGVLLTAFNTMQSWTVYTTNDYLWERFSPPAAIKDGAQSFDAQQSFWRTAFKYMTGKPVVASIKMLALYVYTGSAVTAVAYGAAATAGASVIFFANNIVWDFYDHVAIRAPSAPEPKITPENYVR